MSFLTTESIVEIVNGLDVDPKVSIHPSAVEYLHQLVKPYADAIETATIEQLRDWIHAAFKGDLVDSAVDALDTYVNGLIKEEDAEGRPITPETPEILTAARSTVIDALLKEILNDSAREPLANNSNIILPWDVQDTISTANGMFQMFGIPPLNPKLYVNFFLATGTFNHEVSLDFVAGFLLFGNSSGITTGLSMFGHPITFPDILGKDAESSRFQGKDYMDVPYNMTTNGVTYTFETPEFMQGFATGAQWAGVDHHAYWTSLSYQGNPVTF